MNEIVDLSTPAIAISIDLTRGATITHIGKTFEQNDNVLAKCLADMGNGCAPSEINADCDGRCTEVNNFIHLNIVL